MATLTGLLLRRSKKSRHPRKPWQLDLSDCLAPHDIDKNANCLISFTIKLGCDL